MATEILAVGTTQAASSDVTVVAGTPLTVALKANPANNGYVEDGALVYTQLKDDAGAYNTVDQLQTPGRTCFVIEGPGVYRFVRVGNGVSCGVFSG